jgi:hypothetical protein
MHEIRISIVSISDGGSSEERHLSTLCHIPWMSVGIYTIPPLMSVYGGDIQFMRLGPPLICLFGRGNLKSMWYC